MLKFLRIVVTVLSLTACVLLVALWVRSYYWKDQMGTLSIGRLEIIAESEWGETFFVVHEFSDIAAPPLMYFYCDSIGEEDEYFFDAKSREAFGFNYWVEEGPFSIGGTCILIPHWFWALLSAIVAVTLWLPWSRRFSLRTLLIATTLVAVGLGIIVAAI